MTQLNVAHSSPFLRRSELARSWMWFVSFTGSVGIAYPFTKHNSPYSISACAHAREGGALFALKVH